MTFKGINLLSITACMLCCAVSPGTADEMTGRNRYALIIAAKTIGPAQSNERREGGTQSDEVSMLVDRTVWLLEMAGFSEEEVQIFSEDGAEDKPYHGEITAQAVLDHVAGLEKTLGDEDELWVFIYGHANINKRGLSIYTQGRRLRGRELAEALDRVPGWQAVFCLNRQSSVLMELLADERRVVVTATNDPRQLNPPLFGRHLLVAWADDPTASLLDVLRQAGRDMQKDYTSRGMVYAELAQAHDGSLLRSMPFEGLDGGRLAELRLKMPDPDKIVRYEVGQKVCDFPKEPDMSRPESAYAAINRVLVHGEASGWQQVSVARLAERLGAAEHRKLTSDQARRWLQADILEVQVFRGRYAVVISQPATDEANRPQFDARHLELEGGQWLNTGHGIWKTRDQAIEKFAFSCSRRVAGPKHPPVEDPQAYLKPFTDFLRQNGRRPREFILEALADHKIVVIGEIHHRPAYWALNRAVVQDPQFAESAGTIYMELPSNDQHLVEAFLANTELDTKPIIEMLRDNLWTGWPDQAMLEFFITVWRTNQSLPAKKRIRIVLVDMQRPWRKIQHRRDWRKYNVDRNDLMAKLILKDISRSQDDRNALFIVGLGHAIEDVKLPVGEFPFRTAGWHLCRELGEDVYTILQHGPVMTNLGRLDGRVCLGLFDSAFEKLDYAPVAFELDGGPFGEMDCQPMPEIPYRGTYAAAFDAYVFLKRLEDESFASLIEDFYTDEFVTELDRRYRVMNGRGLIDGLKLPEANAENFIAWMRRSWGKPRQWRNRLGPITAWHNGDN